MKKVTLLCGDNKSKLKTYPECYFHSIVTDPPYELGFMGESWDQSSIAFDKSFWQYCLRVLRPGGYLLAFGGSRTYHRVVCAIEDAGFEIRDSLMWLYGTGFPKGLNIHKSMSKKGVSSQQSEDWEGYYTALKPAFEPIVLAQKPFTESSVVENILKWGTGGLNIDACRVPFSSDADIEQTKAKCSFTDKSVSIGFGVKGIYGNGVTTLEAARETVNNGGRYPSNILIDDDSASILDLQSGVSVSSGGQSNNALRGDQKIYGKGVSTVTKEDPGYGDVGGASRFFYCAKASRKERGKDNIHPTVKPLDLMRYLCRLVTPKKGIILDPFAGSGTTAEAAYLEGFYSVMIEKDPNYCQEIKNRLQRMLERV